MGPGHPNTNAGHHSGIVFTFASSNALLDDAENAVRLLEASARRQRWNQGRALRDPDFEPLRPAIEAIETAEGSRVTS